MLAPIPQQDAGHLDQPQVVRRLLLVTEPGWPDTSRASPVFAPAITTERGPPSASTRIERLTPTLALSVGLGPTRSPQNVPCPSLHRPPATQSPRPPTPRTPRSGLPISHPALLSRSTSGRYDAPKSRRGTLLW